MSAAAIREPVRAPAGVPRLLAGVQPARGAASLSEHQRRWGALPVPRNAARGLVEVVAEAGLRGRGGAGFPAAVKLEAVLGAGRRPVVVANGAEGEPPSGKDAVLLAYAPHLVLDGAVLAAHAVGAREAIVAVTDSTRSAVARALAERRSDRISLRLAVVPDRFVAGEETALVHFLNGGPCLPTATPPRPFERGVRGAPTLVQNVETLAHLALVARFGPHWFRSVGTPLEPGSALVTLTGAVRRAGVYEVPLGSTLADLLDDAGGTTGDVQAFLVGGYFGSWVRAADALRARLSDEDLAPLGARLGARAVVALPATACGIAETARVARYLARESAGQCGPCVHGLAAVADDLELLLRPRAETALERLRRRLTLLPGRGACRHPDGAAALIASALDVFAPELRRHVEGGHCGGAGRPTLPTPGVAP